MAFLNPLMLWGALGAAIPLVIHLWGRRRPRRVPFPSLRLIRAGQQQQRSFTRLRELLILLLRMLLIILLCMALASPVVNSRLLAALAPPDQLALILLDTSASMAYRDDSEQVFERAKRAVRTILEALPPGFTPCLFSAGAELERLPDDPAALADLQPGYAQGRVLRLLNRSPQPELHCARARLFLITDLQESNLRGELVKPLPRSPDHRRRWRSKAREPRDHRCRYPLPVPLAWTASRARGAHARVGESE